MGAGGGSFEDYQGGRDFAALKKFAEGLGPACSLANKDACKPEQLKFLEEWAAKSADDRAKEIARMEAEVKALNEAHEVWLLTLHIESPSPESKMLHSPPRCKPKMRRTDCCNRPLATRRAGDHQEAAGGVSGI
jgi:hypothetical protein